MFDSLNLPHALKDLFSIFKHVKIFGILIKMSKTFLFFSLFNGQTLRTISSAKQKILATLLCWHHIGGPMPRRQAAQMHP